MTRTLLEVGAIVQNDRTIITEPGYLLWENGIIAAVGAGDYTGERHGVQIIKRHRSLAMPGLVNSHGHAAMTLLRGAGDDLPLMTWLTERVYPMEAQLTGEAIYWGTQLACWEMMRSGTTCFTDMYMQMHDVARAVEQAGLRAVLSWGMVGFDAETRQKGIANTTSFVETWHNQADGRITTTVGPHAPYTCPPDYLTEIAGLSARLGVPVQIHLSETRVEVEDSLRQHGRTPIAHAQACGLFERPVLAAHCVHATDEDIAIMHQHDVRVAHNPQSNLKLASGVAPVIAMTRAGLTVGLGTDGAASNNNLDMFEELRLAATLHKGISYDATAIPAAHAFRMATQDSARSVFLDASHGVLQTGSPADIVLVNLDSPHLMPGYDLLSNVVYAAGADDVTDTFVAGQHLLSHGEPQTLDVERIRYEVRKIERQLASAIKSL